MGKGQTRRRSKFLCSAASVKDLLETKTGILLLHIKEKLNRQMVEF